MGEKKPVSRKDKIEQSEKVLAAAEQKEKLPDTAALIIEDEAEDAEEGVGAGEATKTKEKAEQASAVLVCSSWKEETLPELREACFVHARDTMKPDDKLDWFVGVCGIFAIGCLGVTVYNIVRYGFDVLFGIMIAAYIIVAAFCLCVPLQKKLSKANFSRGFVKRLMPARLSKAEITFLEDSFSFYRKEKETQRYEKLWDIYETEHYFIFHLTDRSIFPFEKEVMKQTGEVYGASSLQSFFEGLVTRYARKENAKLNEAETAAETRRP